MISSRSLTCQRNKKVKGRRWSCGTKLSLTGSLAAKLHLKILPVTYNNKGAYYFRKYRRSTSPTFLTKKFLWEYSTYCILLHACLLIHVWQSNFVYPAFPWVLAHEDYVIIWGQYTRVNSRNYTHISYMVKGSERLWITVKESER